jgi:hypothetical protein
MRAMVVLLALASVITFAADNAAVAPQAAASFKPQATNLGAEAISIPQMLSYQGKLADTLGQPVPNGDYDVTFKLYTVPSGGSPFWNETQSVTAKAGLFGVLLGSVTPMGSVPAAGAMYLGMAVSGGAELAPRLRIVSAAYAYKADTANYALAGGTPENTWARGTPDSVLYTYGQLGISKGGSENMLYGSARWTHINFGIACTTGTSGQNNTGCTVGGGAANNCGGSEAVIAGGQQNTIAGAQASILGGYNNRAIGDWSSVGGGSDNTASGGGAAIGGGEYNLASGNWDVVAGGVNDTASGGSSFVGGGNGNVAGDNPYSVVCGGSHNRASGNSSFVGGGTYNLASGTYSVIPGGYHDTVTATASFAANNNSNAAYSNSAAFNGQATTASNQTRVGALSKASGTFTIDHPLDPQGKILNHYFIEGPEMRNIYDGEVKLDASGRATVSLPDYFDALNRGPRIQLTGVGSSDVYVAQEVVGNQFTIGGKAGTKVYWQVTGERKDVSAEATRRMMPVEQPKTGPLVGRMLDDDFLAGCMDQLVSEGKAQGIDFRTAAGRAKYEKMKKAAEQ